ncbi:MAG: DUF2933 domain-containing protein [Actinomycetota bacterium]|nr:DUF2933 domain-containing protein [Actinomycetota bacterium]
MKTRRFLQLALTAVAVFVILRVVGFSSGSLPLLLVVVACPLMMYVMMRNMGGMDRSDHSDLTDQVRRHHVEPAPRSSRTSTTRRRSKRYG